MPTPRNQAIEQFLVEAVRQLRWLESELTKTSLSGDGASVQRAIEDAKRELEEVIRTALSVL